MQTPSDICVPLTGLRGKIARRMLESVSTKPHVTLHTEVEVTALLEWHKRWAEQIREHTGARLTLTGTLVKAAALALQRYPRINGRLEGEQVHLYSMINIGVAVALDEGLLVPVVRDADAKPLPAIAAELARLVPQAQAGKLKPPDLMDATFTISNLGPYGITHFTPIINLPEIAILGVGRIIPVPRLRGSTWHEVSMLNLDLSFDHAAIDGAQAARFLQHLTEVLGTPEQLMVPRAAATVPSNSV